MRPDQIRFVALTSVVLVGGLVVIAAQANRPEAAMRTAAKALIAALNDEQRTILRMPFDADERMNWQFVPIARKGLPLKQMNEPQRKIAFDLLKTGLSASGYTKAETIRSLENVLRAQSGSATARSRAVLLQHLRRPGRRVVGLALRRASPLAELDDRRRQGESRRRRRSSARIRPK